MKKILLLTAFCSISVWAKNPFPESCEKFIVILEEATNLVAKEDPTKTEELKGIKESFAEMKDEWEKIQSLDSKFLRENGEKMFTEICEQGLKDLDESLEKIKTENK